MNPPHHPPTEAASKRDLVNRGLSPERIAAEFMRLHGSVYVPRTSVPDARARIAAAVASAPDGCVVGGVAASILHGCTWFDGDFEIELFREPTACNRPGRSRRIIRTDLREDEITTVDGMRVTTPERTAYDLGRRRPDFRALGQLEDLARATSFSIPKLTQMAEMRKGRRGVRQLRALIPFINGKGESPLEAWLKLFMVQSGLPLPVVQWEVFDEFGDFVARVDLAYVEAKIAVEYDGEEFHSTPEQIARDEKRDARLRKLGWTVIHVRKDELRTNPDKVMNKIRTALRERGALY